MQKRGHYFIEIDLNSNYRKVLQRTMHTWYRCYRKLLGSTCEYNMYMVILHSHVVCKQKPTQAQSVSSLIIGVTSVAFQCTHLCAAAPLLRLNESHGRT